MATGSLMPGCRLRSCGASTRGRRRAAQLGLGIVEQLGQETLERVLERQLHVLLLAAAPDALQALLELLGDRDRQLAAAVRDLAQQAYARLLLITRPTSTDRGEASPRALSLAEAGRFVSC